MDNRPTVALLSRSCSVLPALMIYHTRPPPVTPTVELEVASGPRDSDLPADVAGRYRSTCSQVLMQLLRRGSARTTQLRVVNRSESEPAGGSLVVGFVSNGLRRFRSEARRADTEVDCRTDKAQFKAECNYRCTSFQASGWPGSEQKPERSRIAVVATDECFDLPSAIGVSTVL